MKNFIALLMIFALLAVSADVIAAQRNESDFDYRIPFFCARIANCQKAVSLRHAPDVSSDCIVEIPLGTKVFVKDKLPINDFAAVIFQGRTGYVLSRYIRAISWIECRDENDFIGAVYYAHVANCKIAVSLRYAPDTSADCIVEIPLGTKVEVIDMPATVTYNGFLPVKFNGCKGYVLAEYLESIPYSGGVAFR